MQRTQFVNNTATFGACADDGATTPDNLAGDPRVAYPGRALRTLRLVDGDAIIELEHVFQASAHGATRTDLQINLRLVAPGIRAQFHGNATAEALSTFERCLESLLIGREHLAAMRTSGPDGALLQVRRLPEHYTLALFVTQASLQRSSFALQGIRLQQADLHRLACWCAIGATCLNQQVGYLI